LICIEILQINKYIDIMILLHKDESGAETFRLFRGKNGNRMKIWKQKQKSAERKRKWNFFGGSGNGNGTAIFGGTDAETEVSVSD
jgi:hypothetical protein